MSQQSISMYGDKATVVHNIIQPKLKPFAHFHTIATEQDIHLFSANIVLLCFNRERGGFQQINAQFEKIKRKAKQASFILVEDTEVEIPDTPEITAFKETHLIKNHLLFSPKKPQELIDSIKKMVPELAKSYDRKSYEDYSYILKAMLIHTTATGVALLAAGLAVKFIIASTSVFIPLFAASGVCGVASLGIAGTFFKHYIDKKRKESAPNATTA
jgi:hypothetical protein